MEKPQVVLSNGYGQFHLARLAENLSSAGQLGAFFTGAYVTGKFTARHLQRSRAARRLFERRIAVPDGQVKTFWAGEVPHQVAQRLRHHGRQRAADWFISLSLDSYARWAGKRIGTVGAAQIYHFRAGMGGRSVAAAAARGMTTICDHSIAHPRLLSGLIDGTGSTAQELSSLWRRVEHDMAQADGIIVNSDFVAQTCVSAGIDRAKIHVAYTGVDPQFLRIIDSSGSRDFSARPTVVFAGTLELRKGVDTYVEAVRLSDPNAAEWLLVGSWEPDAGRAKGRVPAHLRELDRLPRHQLAETIARSSVFVFPSRAEGSARVVAEALAAGCYVIATPQTGSVLRDGVDGRLVAPGDVSAIQEALQTYFAFSAEERAERADVTREYARRVLSEDSYTESVVNAYRLISRP